MWSRFWWWDGQELGVGGGENEFGMSFFFKEYYLKKIFF